MTICGPKLSLCGLIISAWGVVQLALMGIFYRFHAVALAEDIPGVDEKITDIDVFYSQVHKGYIQNSLNCWIAACLYLVTLAFSAHQFWSNNRSSLSV